MKKVLLSNIHKYFIVDDEDYLRTNVYTWRLVGRDNGVIQATIYSKEINIGRFILGKSDLPTVDHINLNLFDNRRCNLRNASYSQNNANKLAYSNNISGYKGVSWDTPRNKWHTCIRVNKKTIHLGRFNDIIEAAKAYNMAAIKYFGEFACLNILPEMEAPVK